MIWLVFGVVLWSGIHFVPTLARPLRQRLIDTWGDGRYRAVFSVVVLVSIALMVIGWRGTPEIAIYQPASWSRPVGYLLMIVSFILFGASHHDTVIKRLIRHPQLTAMIVWAISHLITNGSTRAIVLFGGLAKEYAVLVDQVAEQRGHCESTWHTLNFEQKFTRLVARDPAAYEYLDISLPLREHLDESAGMHCPGRSGVGEIFIPGKFVDQQSPVNLAVKAGGVVLLHKRTWHGAGPNQSDRIRWSFDLRYQPPGYQTGRDCFPGFLARSVAEPGKVLTSAATWRALWNNARSDIASGIRSATFNQRWLRHREDPLCA